jgi:hypothetical protein
VQGSVFNQIFELSHGNQIPLHTLHTKGTLN